MQAVFGFREMLEQQIELSKRDKKAQADELNATLWWEKAERRERAAASAVDMKAGGHGAGGYGGQLHSGLRREEQLPRQDEHGKKASFASLHDDSGGGGGSIVRNGRRGSGNGEEWERGERINHDARFESDGGRDGRSGDDSGGGALEVLVLENVALRKEAEALRRTVAAYEARFGCL